jgi:hypothetical protein
LLLLKANFLSPIGERERDGFELSHAIKANRMPDAGGFGDGETR